MNNPYCDGSGPHAVNPEVRVLPTGGDSNAILCRACFLAELRYRFSRNMELCDSSKFDLPAWDSLKVYGPYLESVILEHNQTAVELLKKAMEK